MAITAYSGPIVVYGVEPFPPLDYNPDLAPSLFFGGVALLDPRAPYTYLPGESQSQIDYAFAGADSITTLSIVPYTATVGAISATANATSATLPLVTANSATTGVYITPSVVRSDTGATDTGVNGAGLVALDSFTSVTGSITNGVLTITANTAMPVTPGMVVLATTGTITSGSLTSVQAGVGSSANATTVVISQLSGGTVGQGVAGTYLLSNSTLTATSGTVTLSIPNPSYAIIPYGTVQAGGASIGIWNPQALVSRVVGVTAATGATATSATVTGYDMYGYPMVETFTVTAGSQTTGKKAWRYIRSVTLNAADATHTYSVDTISTFGLPIRSDNFGDLFVNYAASTTAVTGITAATGYLPSDRTSPATATTGDVRGTFGGFTAATGASKLVIRQSPPSQNLGSAVGLFGQTNYTNF